MKTVGFIGLGVMGRPMAAHLVTSGHAVKGFSRSATTREAARVVGIPLADSIADAVGVADVVITMLPDSPDVEQVALGEDGVLEHMAAGATYIDMSTIRPDTARRIAGRFSDAGHGVLDAPVSGGEAGAKEGTLSIMIGGEATILAEQRDLLGAMGSTLTHVGAAGAGQVTKAANQLVVAAHLQALAEAMVFLEAQGADAEAALAAISKGLGGSTVIDRKARSVLAGEFDPGFRTVLHDKDLRIVMDSAQSAGTVLPVTSAVAQLMRSLVATGRGELDHSALVVQARELNGSESA